MRDKRDTCPDCAVEIGATHIGGCDVARCLWDGGQRIQCDGSLGAECAKVLREAGRDDLADDLMGYLGIDDYNHDCGEEVWTGTWPGVEDCQRLDFWCTDPAHPPMKPCTKETPGAAEDLNRLLQQCRWDRETQRWELRYAKSDF